LIQHNHIKYKYNNFKLFVLCNCYSQKQWLISQKKTPNPAIFEILCHKHSILGSRVWPFRITWSHRSLHSQAISYWWSFVTKARYTLPVRTGRSDGPFERVVCIGLKAVFTLRTTSYDSAGCLDVRCRTTSCDMASSAVVRCRAQCEHRLSLYL